jgi:hypothetical protein
MPEPNPILSTYEKICREKCKWCAKGYQQFDMGPVHHWVSDDSLTYFGSCEVCCTAPTKDDVIESLRAALVVARNAVKEISETSGNRIYSEAAVRAKIATIAMATLAALDAALKGTE